MHSENICLLGSLLCRLRRAIECDDMTLQSCHRDARRTGFFQEEDESVIVRHDGVIQYRSRLTLSAAHDWDRCQRHFFCLEFCHVKDVIET